MSAWKRKAIEFLPSLRSEIQEANSVSYLWVEISAEFNQAVESENCEVIDGTLKYLVWSTGSESGEEAKQAVFCGFLEDIACRRENWKYFNSWFTKQEYEKYKGSFAYALSEKEFNKLNDAFYEK